MYLNMALEAISVWPSWIFKNVMTFKNVKIVSECSKNLSIRYGLPNLVERVASFASLAHLVQEISLLMVFNMA